MRNLIRQPLTWIVIAECIVVVLLVIVVWNVIAAASAQRAGAAQVQAIDSPTAATNTPTLPDVARAAKPATRAQLPGLNLDGGFWRIRLSQLNRDQVFFEQLEWRIVHNAMDAAQGYLETVVVPSITRAERVR